MTPLLKAFKVVLLSSVMCFSVCASSAAYSEVSVGTPESQASDSSQSAPKKHKPKKEKQVSSDPVVQGKELLASRCSTCHTAPAPTVHALSDWPAVLNRMAPRAFLSPDEEKMIMQYFESVLQSKN